MKRPSVSLGCMALCVALSASAAKQQQAQAQRQQQMSTWNRAVGACLEARGYTVR